MKKLQNLAKANLKTIKDKKNPKNLQSIQETQHLILKGHGVRVRQK